MLTRLLLITVGLGIATPAFAHDTRDLYATRDARTRTAAFDLNRDGWTSPHELRRVYWERLRLERERQLRAARHDRHDDWRRYEARRGAQAQFEQARREQQVRADARGQWRR